MKQALRCTRVKERPDVSDFQQYNPQIEKCETCNVEIWVTSVTRKARDEIGKDNILTLCKECCLTEMANQLQSGKADTLMHFRADGTVTTISKGD